MLVPHFISPIRLPFRSPLRSAFSMRRLLFHGQPVRSPVRQMKRPGGSFGSPVRRFHAI